MAGSSDENQKSIVELLDVAMDHFNCDRYSEALEIFERAYALDPDNTDILLGLGATYYSLGRFQDGIAPLTRLLEMNPDDVMGLGYLGECCYFVDESPKCIQCYRRITEIEPLDAQGFIQLGTALNKFENYEDALPVWKKAIDLDPKNPLTYNGLGVAYLGIKRLDESIKAFQNAIDIDASKPVLHYNIAIAFLNMNKTDLAYSHYMKLKKLDVDMAKEIFKLMNPGVKRQPEAEKKDVAAAGQPFTGFQKFIISGKATALFIIALIATLVISKHVLKMSSGIAISLTIGVFLAVAALRLIAYFRIGYGRESIGEIKGIASDLNQISDNEFPWKKVFFILGTFVVLFLLVLVIGIVLGPFLSVIILFLFALIGSRVIPAFQKLGKSMNLRSRGFGSKVIWLSFKTALGDLIIGLAALAFTYLGSRIMLVMYFHFRDSGPSGLALLTKIGATLFGTAIVVMAVFLKDIFTESGMEMDEIEQREAEMSLKSRIANPQNKIDKLANQFALYGTKRPTIIVAILSGAFLGLVPNLVRMGGAGNVSLAAGKDSFLFIIQAGLDAITQDLWSLYVINLTALKPSDFLAKTYYIIVRFAIFGLVFSYFLNLRNYVKGKLSGAVSAEN